MVRRHFVPFFERTNQERKAKTKPSSSFPNYMNWYIPREQAEKSVLQKRALSFQSGTHGGRFPKYNQKKNYQPLDTHYRKEQKAKHSIIKEDTLSEESLAMKRRKERHQAIRKELEDYQTYQFRQPFKRTEVPSIWQESKSSVHKKAEKSLISSNPPVSKPEIPSPPKNKIKRKNHLNKGLADIMTQEQSGKNSRAFIEGFHRDQNKR